MLATPMDVLSQFPVRKTKQQKQDFRDAVQAYVTGMGYPVAVEEGSFDSRNMIIGDPEKAKILVTAHYDTPARMPWPNAIAPTSLVTSILKSIPTIALFWIGGYFGGYFLGRGKFLLSLLVFSCLIGLFMLMRVGPANKSNANDNTSGVVTVLEIIRTLLPAHRDQVCFVLFDLEEAGLIGSESYRKAHKEATEHQVVLNLDCVGDGDEIVFFPSKKLKQDSGKMAWLKRCGGYFGQKKITIYEKGFSNYPSDHKHFPVSAGIGAFHRNKGKKLFLTRIHTHRDTVLEETNVNILRACISTLITQQ